MNVIAVKRKLNGIGRVLKMELIPSARYDRTGSAQNHIS